jgi:hypothetical protein
MRAAMAATLVEVENTHNRAGGVVVPQADVLRICALARELGLATIFLDGARLSNASAASGLPMDELAAPRPRGRRLQQGPGRARLVDAGGIEGLDRIGRASPPASGRSDAPERHLRRRGAACARLSPVTTG